MKKLMVLLLIGLLLLSGCDRSSKQTDFEESDIQYQVPEKDSVSAPEQEIIPQTESNPKREPSSDTNSDEKAENPDPVPNPQHLFDQEFHMEDYPLEELLEIVEICEWPLAPEERIKQFNPSKTLVFIGQKDGKSKMRDSYSNYYATTPIKVNTPLYGDIREGDRLYISEMAYVLSHQGTLKTHSYQKKPVINREETYLFVLHRNTPDSQHCSKEAVIPQAEWASIIAKTGSSFEKLLLDRFIGPDRKIRLDLYDAISKLTDHAIDPYGTTEEMLKPLSAKNRALIERLIDQYGVLPPRAPEDHLSNTKFADYQQLEKHVAQAGGIVIRAKIDSSAHKINGSDSYWYEMRVSRSYTDQIHNGTTFRYLEDPIFLKTEAAKTGSAFIKELKPLEANKEYLMILYPTKIGEEPFYSLLPGKSAILSYFALDEDTEYLLEEVKKPTLNYDKFCQSAFERLKISI